MPSATTRMRIVEKADALFYEAGSMRRRFQISPLRWNSRGNFYHHFKTKDQIWTLLSASDLSGRVKMLTKWEDEAQTARARILAFIQILIDNRASIMTYGCPVGTLSTELAKMGHSSQDHANELFALFRGLAHRQFTSWVSANRRGSMPCMFWPGRKAWPLLRPRFATKHSFKGGYGNNRMAGQRNQQTQLQFDG